MKRRLPALLASRGFTLVEVVVALAIVTTAVAGVARLAGLALLSTSRARTLSAATMLAMQKMEQLRALTWGVAPDQPSVPVSDTTSDLGQDPPAAGGPGLSPSPADTIDRNTPGWVDYLDDAGRWVGGGSSAPARAVYIRRWAVAAWPGDPGNTLVLQVLVTHVATANGRPPTGPYVRQATDALLTSVRTRQSP